MQVFKLTYFSKSSFEFYQLLSSEFNFRCNYTIHLDASIRHYLDLNK